MPMDLGGRGLVPLAPLGSVSVSPKQAVYVNLNRGEMPHLLSWKADFNQPGPESC